VQRSEASDRLILVLVGLLLLLSPALLLLVTLAFLSITGELVLGRLTTLELIELYLIDFLLVGGILLAMFALLKRLLEHRLGAALDSLAVSGEPTDETEAEAETDASGEQDPERTE